MGSFAKRIFLFMAVNLLIVITITTILSILGVKPYITAAGLDYNSLAAFCLVWGMGGAFISLALSRVMAKFMMGVKVIDPNSQGQEGELLRTVYALAKAARLPAMPQVGIYDSPEVNAFATGPSKKRALVAVSTGLLHKMNKEEVEGVLAHEIAHVANGDMVTMTLIQGIINAFVMFFARVLAFAISQALASRNGDRDSRPSPMINFFITIVLEIVFSILGMMVVAFFSRRREYRADSGGATLAGRQKMISALRSLQRTTQLVDVENSSLATLKISGKRSRFAAFFSTHPPLEDRILKLEMGA